MKTFLSIIRWAAGGMFFLICFIILFICLACLSKPHVFRVARRLFSLLIRIVGIKLIVNGRHYIDPDKTYLMMGNHQSLFDLFVIPAAIPLCFTGVEASYHFSLPVWGYMIRKWGCIPIERNNLKSAVKSLEIAQKTVRSGMSLCILPEGHRTRTGRLGTFKKGPFHLARGAKADLLLFGINGLYEFAPKGRFQLKPGPVVVNIGRPVPYNDIKDMSVNQLQELCFTRIRTLSENI